MMAQRFLALAVLSLFALASSAPVADEVSEVYCHVCADAIDNNDCNKTELCDVEHAVCLTTMVFDDSAISIEKRCARKQICYNMQENNDDGCFNTDDEFDGICNYCCETPGCNEFLPTFDIEHDSGQGANSKHTTKPKSQRTTKPKSQRTTKPKSQRTTRPKSQRTTRPKSQRTTRPKSQQTSRPKANTQRPSGKPQTRRTAKPTTPNTPKPSPSAPKATSPPATSPPATAPPATNNNVVNGAIANPSNGQTPCPHHGTGGNGGTGTGSLLFPGIKITIDLQINGGGMVQSPAQQPCTCNSGQGTASRGQQQPGSQTSGPLPPVTASTAPPASTAQPTTSQPSTAPPTSAQTTTPMNSTTAMNVTSNPNATAASNATASSNSSSSTPSSTQAATTTQTTVTTTKATTVKATTTKAPTTTPKATQCYTCQDTLCQKQQLTTCPSNQPLCINTITQALSGDRTFTKGCATEAVCKDKWWLKTAGLADCFLLDNSPSGPVGMKLDACSFCCTGDKCNQDAIPDMSDIYQP